MKKTTTPSGKEQFYIQYLDALAECEYIVNTNSHATILITAGGTKSLNGKVHVRLVGVGAQATILGAFINADNVEIKLETLQHHEARSTSSNLLVKSILTHGSKFSYNGAIRVEKAGQQTDAYQRNENLLLSSEAHAQSKPSLEILADDVRCTHGATIGTVDQDQLMYLQCRGIPISLGKRLIVEGFLETVLSKAADHKDLGKVKEDLWETLSKQQL